METYSVYVLYSPSSSKFYVGQTSDINKRLLQHNDASYISYTSRYAPWIVHWMITVDTRAAAMKLERYLKKKNRAFIERLKNDDSLNQYIIDNYKL